MFHPVYSHYWNLQRIRSECQPGVKLPDQHFVVNVVHATQDAAGPMLVVQDNDSSAVAKLHVSHANGTASSLESMNGATLSVSEVTCWIHVAASAAAQRAVPVHALVSLDSVHAVPHEAFELRPSNVQTVRSIYLFVLLTLRPSPLVNACSSSR